MSYSSSLETKYSQLCQSIGFNHVRNLVGRSLGITGTSKKNLLENFVSNESPELHATMAQVRLDSVLGGDRQFTICELDEHNSNLYQKFFKDVLPNGDHPLSKAYPFLLSDEEICGLDDKLHVLDKIVQKLGDTEYQIVVFGTVLKVPITKTADALLNEDGDALANSGAKFYYRIEKAYQFLHTVIFEPNSRRLTITCDRTADNIKQTKARDELYRLKMHLTELSCCDLGNRVNLFDFIKPLYNAGDGNVTKLGIVTTDNNPVNLTLNIGEKCLREDRYHKTGEGLISGFYAVGKSWDRLIFELETEKSTFEAKSKLHLHLKSNSSALLSGGFLFDGYISNCPRFSDLLFVLDKSLDNEVAHEAEHVI